MKFNNLFIQTAFSAIIRENSSGRFAMKILVYLYDESGKEKEVNLEEINVNNINDQQLLWINILERDVEAVRRVTTALHLIKVPIKGLLRTRSVQILL